MPKAFRRNAVASHTDFIEPIEPRTLMSAAPLASPPHHGIHAALHQRHHPGRVRPNLVQGAAPDAAAWSGYGHTPKDIRTAYGFGALADQGAGQTIAIVDAYDAPNIAADLATFDADPAIGLPGTNTGPAGSAGSVANYLTKVGQNGPFTSTNRVPKANGSWAQEISLDVEWAHAVAPGAKILLVEANSNGNADLLKAVDYARQNASVVSMSWGGPEYATESNDDFHFTSPSASHPVTFVASAGDTGGQREWPATSPNVLAVGGTTLSFNADATYNGETAWSNSGGGTSAYETLPAFQANVPSADTAAGTRRSAPDVGYDADPNSGFAVYDSYRYQGRSGWMVFGGTSAGAPQWAALVAVANAGRTTALDGVTQTLPALYDGRVPAGDFHDVASGTTTGGTSAVAGYDQVTGQGTPFNAQRLIGDLILV